MTYLILANLSLTMFFGIYLLVLKRLTFFQWNRIYLLTALIVSFTVPLLQFVDLSQHKDVYQSLVVMDMGESDAVAITEVKIANDSWSAMDWVWLVYIGGVAWMLLWLGVRLYRVLSSFGRKITEQQSFSFFNRVFLATESNHRHIIEAHELVHVQQGHSYDLLLLETLRIFNWFNPTFYYYLKELKLQHECIADEISADDKVQYAELLVANAIGVFPSVLVHEFSNQSLLKRRIMMLFKNKSKKINKAKYILVLPTILLVSGVTLAFNASIKETVEPWEHTSNRPSDELLTSLTKKVENIIQPDIRKSVAEGLSAKMTFEGRESQVENQQTVTYVVPQEKEDTVRVFTAVEINPEPKEGIRAFREWVGENYDYPQAAIDAGVKGQVVVSFIVEADGQLSSFKIIKDLGHGTGEKALALLKIAEPWRPGIQNGKKVRVAYTLPITMNLQK